VQSYEVKTSVDGYHHNDHYYQVRSDIICNVVKKSMDRIKIEIDFIRTNVFVRLTYCTSIDIIVSNDSDKIFKKVREPQCIDRNKIFSGSPVRLALVL
jgi:hypothetical protein